MREFVLDVLGHYDEVEVVDLFGGDLATAAGSVLVDGHCFPEEEEGVGEWAGSYV
jgi:hypothetical protein